MIESQTNAISPFWAALRKVTSAKHEIWPIRDDAGRPAQSDSIVPVPYGGPDINIQLSWLIN